MRKNSRREIRKTVTGPDGQPVTIRFMSAAMIRDDYMRRRVAETIIGSGKRSIRVSTCRLHSIRDYGPEIETLAALASVDVPDEWDTMVFGGPLDGFNDRTETREAAKITHRLVVFAARLGAQKRAAERARLRRLHSAYRARRK